MPADDDGRPSFAEVVKAVTPPGVNWDDWKAAMRQARQDGGYRPGQVAPDISLPMPQMPRCTYCQKWHDPRMDCGYGPRPAPPADPFTEADPASIALAEMYHSMIRAGIPVASVEGILGRMLAEHGRDDPEPPDE